MRLRIENESPFETAALRECATFARTGLREIQGTSGEPSRLVLRIRRAPRIRRWRYNRVAAHGGIVVVIALTPAMCRDGMTHGAMVRILRHVMLRVLYPKVSAEAAARAYTHPYPAGLRKEAPLPRSAPKVVEKPSIHDKYEAALARCGKAQNRIKKHERALKRAQTDLKKAQADVARHRRALLEPVVDTRKLSDAELRNRLRLARQRA